MALWHLSIKIFENIHLKMKSINFLNVTYSKQNIGVSFRKKKGDKNGSILSFATKYYCSPTFCLYLLPSFLWNYVEPAQPADQAACTQPEV